MKRFGISGQAMAAALVGAGIFSAIALGPKLFSPEAGAQPIAIQAPHGAPMSFADLIERVEPAVVSVNVVTEREVSELSDAERFFDFFRGGPNLDQFGDENPDSDESEEEDEDDATPSTREARSLGSGFFISADGLIVTNNHVIKDATKIEVTLEDGRELDAELVGADPSTDLAVLRVKEPGTFKYVNFDNSATLRKGDWVVAVGNPFGFGGTATAGILSADGRGGGRDNPYTDYLQIDAAINRGNSGGPTFDLKGNVVGVNTAIISPTGGSVGIGFMIPAKLANEVTQMLIKDGKVSRGYLGVSIGDYTEDMAEAEGLVGAEGAIIADVNLASPAEKGGLKRGDVITAVNGKTVTDASTTTRAVGRLLANTANKFDILRDGKPMIVNVTVGERPDDLYANDNRPQPSEDADTDEDKGDATKDFGVSFKPLDADSRKALNLRETEQGVVITDLEKDSPLAELGLVKGLGLLEVNNQTVTSAAAFDRAIDDARKAGRSKVLMAIRSPQGTFYSTLDMSEKE